MTIDPRLPMTISELIDVAGPAQIVERINKLRAAERSQANRAQKATRKRRRGNAPKQDITTEAVYKWRKRGKIPPDYWNVLMELTGVSLEQIYAIVSARNAKAA